MPELSGIWGAIEKLRMDAPISYRQAWLEANGDGSADGRSYWPGSREILDRSGITIGGVMVQEAKDILTGASKRSMENMPPKMRLKELLTQNREAIMAAMPQHMNPDRLLRVAQTACTSTPQLMECYVPSLLGGIMQAAQFGLEPNTPMGHCYLVPYRRNLAKRGQPPRHRQDCQLIIGYRGLIDLARRSGQIVSISAHCVHAGDEFEWEYGLEEKLKHKPAGGVRGDITHAYAVAKLVGGGHAFEVMTRAEIDHVMLGSQSGGKWGPWRDRYEPMARKSAIRMLVKYLPMTVELAKASEADSRTVELRADGVIDSIVIDSAMFDEGGTAAEQSEEKTGVDPLPPADHGPPAPVGWPQSVDDGQGGSTWADSAGELFDPAQHGTSRDGRPAVVSDGRFRARRGAGKAPTEPQGQSRAQASITAGDGAAAGELAHPGYDGPSVDEVMLMIRNNVTDELCVADVQAILTDMPASLVGKDHCVAALERQAAKLEAQ